MKLSREQIKSLKVVLGKTHESEIDCDECLDHVGEYAELEISGQTIPEALESVSHHLELCQECQEEYQTLLKAIQELAKFEE